MSIAGILFMREEIRHIDSLKAYKLFGGLVDSAKSLL